MENAIDVHIFFPRKTWKEAEELGINRAGVCRAALEKAVNDKKWENEVCHPTS